MRKLVGHDEKHASCITAVDPNIFSDGSCSVQAGIPDSSYHDHSCQRGDGRTCFNARNFALWLRVLYLDALFSSTVRVVPPEG